MIQLKIGSILLYHLNFIFEHLARNIFISLTFAHLVALSIFITLWGLSNMLPNITPSYLLSTR